MTIFESVGIGWCIFTCAIAHVAVLFGAFQYYRELWDRAKRGKVEEIADARKAGQMQLSPIIVKD